MVLLALSSPARVKGERRAGCGLLGGFSARSDLFGVVNVIGYGITRFGRPFLVGKAYPVVPGASEWPESAEKPPPSSACRLTAAEQRMIQVKLLPA